MDLIVGNDEYLKGEVIILDENDYYKLIVNTQKSVVEFFIEDNSESYLINLNKNNEYINYFGTNDMQVIYHGGVVNPNLKCEYNDQYFIKIDEVRKLAYETNPRDACLESPTVEFEHSIPPNTELIYKLSEHPLKSIDISKTTFNGDQSLFRSATDENYSSTITYLRSIYSDFDNIDTNLYFSFINPSNEPVPEFIQISNLDDITFDLYEENKMYELYKFEGYWSGEEQQEFREFDEKPGFRYEGDKEEVITQYPSFTFTIYNFQNVTIYLDSDIDNEMFISDSEGNRIDYYYNEVERDNDFAYYHKATQRNDFNGLNSMYLFEEMVPGTYKVFAKAKYLGDSDNFTIKINGF